MQEDLTLSYRYSVQQYGEIQSARSGGGRGTV